MRLLIDPGHGGGHNGAVVGDVREKDLTLELSHRLRESIGDMPVDAALTRIGDTTAHPSDRSRAEEAHRADWVISIHCNALPANTGAYGLECYHWPGNLAARVVSEAIARACPVALRNPDRTQVIEAYNDPSTSRDDWIEAPRAVLGWYSAPTVLVECGYLTNDIDRQRLQSDVWQERIVTSIRMGVCEALDIHRRSTE